MTYPHLRNTTRPICHIFSKSKGHTLGLSLTKTKINHTNFSNFYGHWYYQKKKVLYQTTVQNVHLSILFQILQRIKLKKIEPRGHLQITIKSMPKLTKFTPLSQDHLCDIIKSLNYTTCKTDTCNTSFLLKSLDTFWDTHMI